jgi:hypothetical protein
LDNNNDKILIISSDKKIFLNQRMKNYLNLEKETIFAEKVVENISGAIADSLSSRNFELSSNIKKELVYLLTNAMISFSFKDFKESL